MSCSAAQMILLSCILWFGFVVQWTLVETVQLTTSANSNVFVTSLHPIWVLRCVPVWVDLHWTRTWEIAQVRICTNTLCWFNGCKCDSILSADVDECSASNANPCTQNCTNTIGSFVCSCTSGYRLGSDGFTCEGIIFADIIIPGSNAFDNVQIYFIIDAKCYVHEKSLLWSRTEYWLDLN